MVTVDSRLATYGSRETAARRISNSNLLPLSFLDSRKPFSNPYRWFSTYGRNSGPRSKQQEGTVIIQNQLDSKSPAKEPTTVAATSLLTLMLVYLGNRPPPLPRLPLCSGICPSLWPHPTLRQMYLRGQISSRRCDRVAIVPTSCSTAFQSQRRKGCGLQRPQVFSETSLKDHISTAPFCTGPGTICDFYLRCSLPWSTGASKTVGAAKSS